jgi:hypothetical protein
VPLKGFEVGEQRSLQRLGPPPRPRCVRRQSEGLQPPASSACPWFPPPEKDLWGRKNAMSRTFRPAVEVRNLAWFLPGLAAARRCAIVGLVCPAGVLIGAPALRFWRCSLLRLTIELTPEEEAVIFRKNRERFEHRRWQLGEGPGQAEIVEYEFASDQEEERDRHVGINSIWHLGQPEEVELVLTMYGLLRRAVRNANSLP